MATENSPVEATSSRDLPYSATTSDGEARPVRKIKPPSDSFMKPGEPAATPRAPATESAPTPAHEPEKAVEPAPLPPEEELLGPAAATPHAAPTLSGPAAAETAGVPEPAAATMKNVDVAPERIAAELKELDELVGLESLKYLQPRVSKAKAEGADALTLVAFYRLAARTLKDDADHARMAADQYKKEFEKARARVSKMEVEFAGAVEAARSGGSGKDTEETQTRLKQLEKQLDQANEQREKLLLDFRNVRDRAQKDTDFKVFKEKEKFFQNFLPVLDSFDRANLAMTESAGIQSVLEGFRILYSQLMEALESEGLEKVNIGGSFDPRFHEAIGEVETQEKPDDHIYDELSRGYKLGERLIRPAMVRVARNPSGVVLGSASEPVKPPEEPSDSEVGQESQE